jgi:hypothetical protein
MPLVIFNRYQKIHILLSFEALFEKEGNLRYKDLHKRRMYFASIYQESGKREKLERF